MVRVSEGGAAIELEVWELPAREFGSFVAGIPAPLGIGTVELADGTSVPGVRLRGLRGSRREGHHRPRQLAGVPARRVGLVGEFTGLTGFLEG